MSLIKLSQSAYNFNLSQIAKKAGGVNKLICVFKDNAYAHGAAILAPLAADFGVKFIAVKNESEAYELKDFFKQILILSHHPNGSESENFIYAINDINKIKLYKKHTKVHLKIDTGMHRNGVCLDDLNVALNKIKEANLNLCGAFTHFAGSDEIDSSFFVQKSKFELAKKQILENINENLIFHSHNSSALFRGKNLPENELCRVGLAQFGYADNLNQTKLKKVLKLYAHRLSNRVLKANESLGYGHKFTAKNDIKIATYDLGYADGLFRFNGIGELKLANGGAILGKISMDSFCSLDFGEELCVIDDASVWAKFFNTIDYEILVKLNANIKRELDV